jgi:hypothetical protein
MFLAASLLPAAAGQITPPAHSTARDQENCSLGQEVAKDVRHCISHSPPSEIRFGGH